MALMAQSRGRTYTRACTQAVLISVVLSGVLVARNIPPNFPPKPSAHSAFNATSHHDQRPRFDHNGSQWSSPADAFLPTPPVAEPADLVLTSQLFSTLQTKGFHYNRPPPLS
jgi:hypothetical protein